MAEVQRKRTLVNPARKRKRRNARRLSAKQIAAGFGGKRRKAAVKSSRKRKRKNTARRHSPRRNAARRRPRASRRAARPARRRRARRRNPGGIVEVALNPAPRKRRKSVAKTRKRRRRSRTNARRYHRRRTNPAPVRHRRRRRSTARRSNRRRHTRRNPSMGGVSNLIVSAAYAIGGAVGSKYLTQMVLGASNVGYVGYAANIAAAFVAGKAVGMFTKNKQAENSVILGGVIMAVIRFLSDQTPLGSTLQQYGLGDYEASTWLSPARYVNAAQSAAIDIPTALRPAIAAPKGGMSGMRGLGSGTYSRARGTY
jgi:hypothetical protein